MRRHLGLFALAAGSLLLPACGGAGGTDGGTDPLLVCDLGAAPVLTDKLFTDVISTHCVTCHAPDGPAEVQGIWNTAETVQTNMVGKGSKYARAGSDLKIVDPGSPTTSTALLKVLGGAFTFRAPNGDFVGGQMPQTGAPLTEPEKKEFRDWICQGAKAL
jgi:hypothetical protein